MREIREIIWHDSKNIDGNITTWLGKVNGRVIFNIYQFKNDMFTDQYIMTSTVVPTEMKKDDNLDELKETAQILLEAYVHSFFTS